MIDYLILNPLITVSALNGALWVLPLLACCSAVARDGLLKGTWAREWRIGLKVKGCIATWRAAATEGLKVQRAVVTHWVGLNKPLHQRHFYGRSLQMMKEATRLFTERRVKRAWTPEVNDAFVLFGTYGERWPFLLVQIACIMVKAGLANSHTMTILETRVDLMIQSYHDRCVNRPAKLRFRQVVNEVLSHPQLHLRFLKGYHYIKHYEQGIMEALPKYSEFQSVFYCGVGDESIATLVNKLPKCVLGSMVYIIFFKMALTYKRHRLDANLRNMLTAMKGWMGDGAVGKWHVTGKECSLTGDIYWDFDYVVA